MTAVYIAIYGQVISKSVGCLCFGKFVPRLQHIKLLDTVIYITSSDIVLHVLKFSLWKGCIHTSVSLYCQLLVFCLWGFFVFCLCFFYLAWWFVPLLEISLHGTRVFQISYFFLFSAFLKYVHLLNMLTFSDQ